MTIQPTLNFVPVYCKRGRKWRGELGYCVVESAGFGQFNTPYSKIWDPKNLAYVFATKNFVIKHEEKDIDHELLEADKLIYIKQTINGAIRYCRSVGREQHESEINNFARNILMKNHPEMEPWFDEILPDTRDVVAAVERTLSWALKLRTRATKIYGKLHEGGKPYSKNKVSKIAYKTLDKKGYTKIDGFEDAWKMMTNIMGLS